MKLALFIIVLIGLLFLKLVTRFKRGKADIEHSWKNREIKPLEGLKPTKKLEILPLIDWYTASDDLIPEGGVSYLIKTDTSSLLFDTGLNLKQEHPSPLLRNMEKLGKTISDFDTIVISHNHLDHVGGMKNQRKKTFSLSQERIDLTGKKAFTPVPMKRPDCETITVSGPQLITGDVASIGIIENQDFLMGKIEEQSLAVSLKGKGTVIIIGCGHQGLDKILTRAAELFPGPLYGIIGGLHYPVTDSRVKKLGIKLQKYLGTCRYPWDPITIDDVNANIALLKEKKPAVVGLSAHDSCDTAIGLFKEAFGDNYQRVAVGEKIVL